MSSLGGTMSHEECKIKSSVWLYLGIRDIFYPLSPPFSDLDIKYLFQSKKGVAELIFKIAYFMNNMLNEPFNPLKDLKWIVCYEMKDESITLLRGFYEFTSERASGAADFVLIALEESLCLDKESLLKLSRYVNIARNIEPLCLHKNFSLT